MKRAVEHADVRIGGDHGDLATAQLDRANEEALRAKRGERLAQPRIRERRNGRRGAREQGPGAHLAAVRRVEDGQPGQTRAQLVAHETLGGGGAPGHQPRETFRAGHGFGRVRGGRHGG